MAAFSWIAARHDCKCRWRFSSRSPVPHRDNSLVACSSWRRALTIRKCELETFHFDLHGVVGFWTFAVLLMWGLTGGYFVFPEPFRAAINFFTPNSAASPLPRRRPLTLGAKILRGFSFAHYGNFGGWEVKLLWVILGLAPAVLFSTALLMWYNRVLAPALRRLRHDSRWLIGRPQPQPGPFLAQQDRVGWILHRILQRRRPPDQAMRIGRNHFAQLRDVLGSRIGQPAHEVFIENRILA